MNNHVKGIDSRYWNGRYDNYENDEICFAYIKLTDGIWGDKESTLAKVQFDSAGAKGWKRGFFHFWRYATPAKPQAEWFFKHLEPYADELPPAMDFEEKSGPKGAPCREAIDQFGYEFTKLYGSDFIVYTAPHFWNEWVGKTMAGFSRWNPYSHDLWEADPPPETAPPGLWTDYSVLQYKLDSAYPGFNASVDIDYARQAWWDKHTKVIPLWDEMDVYARVATMGELAKMHGLAK